MQLLPGSLLEVVNDLEDDELEHGAGEGEVGAEDELDELVAELVVGEELLDEEDPAHAEEDGLREQDHQGVLQETHPQGHREWGKGIDRCLYFKRISSGLWAFCEIFGQTTCRIG